MNDLIYGGLLGNIETIGGLDPGAYSLIVGKRGTIGRRTPRRIGYGAVAHFFAPRASSAGRVGARSPRGKKDILRIKCL